MRFKRKQYFDVVAYPRKTYAASIVLEDGSQVDLAAYGRSDEKGIIITFYHTTLSMPETISYDPEPF